MRVYIQWHIFFCGKVMFPQMVFLFSLVAVLPFVTCVQELLEVPDVGLEHHNFYREKHKSPPLAWDKQLIKAAKECVEQYAKVWTDIQHQCHKTKYKSYGENIYKTNAMNYTIDYYVKRAIDQWYAEVKYYNYNDLRKNEVEKVGHFTQLVWKATRNLGMAVYRISNETQYANIVVVEAFYTPPGNVRSGTGDPYQFYRENVSATGVKLSSILSRNLIVMIISHLAMFRIAFGVELMQ